MVAPADLGNAAVQRLMSGTNDVGIEYIEGPERYTTKDVASVYAEEMGRDVAVQEVARDSLEGTFRQFGFSDEAAASYACMTRRVIDRQTMPAGEPILGSTSLKSYISAVMSEQINRNGR